MGMLVDGQWTDEDVRSMNSRTGAFERVDSKMRDRITADGSSGYPAEPGRYHVFAAWSCPWAHRTVIFRKILGLENAISLTRADMFPRKHSWAYSEAPFDFKMEGDRFELYQVYQAHDPHYTGRVTVPTLWDTETHKIVNNESSEIIRMMNSEFRAFNNDAPDLYPEGYRDEIDRINDIVYAGVNNGVYRCGFARSQAAYEEAFHKLFETLDYMEDLLGRQRYLAGDRISESDFRAFPTLIRFDAVYYSHFKCNLRRIEDYPNLSNYTRELYQFPGVAETVDIEKFKQGYYGMGFLNPSGIVPVGPALDFTRPHDRDRLPKAG